VARTRKQRQSGGRSARESAAPPFAAPVDESRLLGAAPAAPLNREILAWILLGFFALFVVGFWLLRIPGSEQKNTQSFDRVVFNSLGAVTLTGLRQDVEGSFASAYPKLIPFTLLLLTLGGSYLTLLATALPACRVLALPYSASRIATAAGILIGGGTLLGTGILLLGDMHTPAGGEPVLDAMLKAASAVGNSGVYWGRPPSAGAATTQLGLLPLAILGGLGLPVLLDLYDRATRRTPALSFHTRLVLTLTAAIYVCGVVALLAADSRFLGVLRDGVRERGWTPTQGRELRDLLVSASTLCIESRSAGFASTAVDQLPRAANFVLLLLMAIGAFPAGTGGGLKATTLHVLWRGLRQGMRGERPAPLVGFAIAWTGIFACVVFLGYAVLLWAAPNVPGDQLLSIAVSAASNCGLSRDSLSVVSTSLFTLGLMMVLGRLLPILILWRMAERLEFADTVVA
jgi:Trk-type K+ transport system membrane component